MKTEGRPKVSVERMAAGGTDVCIRLPATAIAHLFVKTHTSRTPNLKI